MALTTLITQLERVINDRKIKTAVFFLSKINSIKKRYLQSNPADEEQVNKLIPNFKIKPLAVLREEVAKKIIEYKKIRKEAEERVAELASQKIMRGSVVFVYGNSQIINKALKLASGKGINFVVYTIDSGFSLEGRKAADEISKANIPVKHFPDILTSEALSKADILFFEPKAITKDGKIITQMGINNILSEAKKKKVFSYCIFNTEKLARMQPGKTNPYEIKNYAVFVKERNEIVKLSNITAIINEHGIIKP